MNCNICGEEFSPTKENHLLCDRCFNIDKLPNPQKIENQIIEKWKNLDNIADKRNCTTEEQIFLYLILEFCLAKYSELDITIELEHCVVYRKSDGSEHKKHIDIAILKKDVPILYIEVDGGYHLEAKQTCNSVWRDFYSFNKKIFTIHIQNESLIYYESDYQYELDWLSNNSMGSIIRKSDNDGCYMDFQNGEAIAETILSILKSILRNNVNSQNVSI